MNDIKDDSVFMPEKQSIIDEDNELQNGDTMI